MTKKEIRSQMKRRNGALTGTQRAAAARAVFAAAERLPAFGQARCVALFCSLADEPPTGEALRRWSATKRVVVPRVEGGDMRFYEYDPSAIRVGAFGIEEPGPAAKLCEPHQIDLMFVPGVAFTAAGERLGRGRGYYDRYLSLPGVRALRVGVCFAHQLVGELPAEPHDVRMDRVICGDTE